MSDSDKHEKILTRLANHGLHIPKGVPYALTVTSNIPVFARYSRLNTTQGAYTLMNATPAGRD
jgi:hypothetical protein